MLDHHAVAHEQDLLDSAREAAGPVAGVALAGGLCHPLPRIAVLRTAHGTRGSHSARRPGPPRCHPPGLRTALRNDVSDVAFERPLQLVEVIVVVPRHHRDEAIDGDAPRRMDTSALELGGREPPHER